MTEPTYTAPPHTVSSPLVGVLESEHGKIVLKRNQLGYGYRLTDDAEGFGAGLVENELTPRLGRRGSMLGTQREAAGTMILPVVITSTSTVEVSRMVAELTKILKLADGTSKISLVDPDTGAGRYREIAYKDGLSTPQWSSPYHVKFALDVDYMDPWAYSTDDESVPLAVAPGASGGLSVPVRFPVRFARSGGVRDRWATNNGENPAPVMLRFDGPMTNPVVELQGFWRFALSGTLAYDEYLIVDTRRTPATINIYSTTRPGHRSAFSWIRDGSRFSDLVIPPGQHAFSFQAVDDTYTASMTASWPHTFSSMQ